MDHSKFKRKNQWEKKKLRIFGRNWKFQRKEDRKTKVEDEEAGPKAVGYKYRFIQELFILFFSKKIIIN